MNNIEDKDTRETLTILGLFPGSNPNVTEVQVQAQVTKVLSQIEAGDYETVTLTEEYCARSLEDKVCSRIQQRAEVGLAKYGVTMERTDLSEKEWLEHAQEEALDLAVYLEKLKEASCIFSKDDLNEILWAVKYISREHGKTTNRAILIKKLQDAIKLV